jgi:hypothetical protein
MIAVQRATRAAERLFYAYMNKCDASFNPHVGGLVGATLGAAVDWRAHDAKVVWASAGSFGGIMLGMSAPIIPPLVAVLSASVGGGYVVSAAIDRVVSVVAPTDSAAENGSSAPLVAPDC